MSEFICGDCLEYIKKMPDDAFELAIVDPPYGDGLHAEDGGGKGWFTKYNQRLIGEDDPEHRNLRGRFDKYNRFGGMFQKSVDAQTTRPNGVPKHDSADPNQIEIPGVTAYSRYGGVGSRFEKYKRTPEEWGLSATSSQTTDREGRAEQAERGPESTGKKS